MAPQQEAFEIEQDSRASCDDDIEIDPSTAASMDKEEESSPSSLFDEWKAQLKTAWPTLLGMVLYKIPWLVSLRFVGGIGADELAAAALASTLCNVTGLSLSVGLSSALTTLAGQARGHLLRQRQLREEASAKAWESEQSIGRTDDDDDDEDCSVTQEESDADEYDNIVLQESEQEEVSFLKSKYSASLSSPESTSKPLMPLVFMYRGMFIQLVVVIPVGLWWLYGIKPLLIGLGQGMELSEMTQNYLRILTPGLWSYSVNFTLTTWLQTMEMADIPAYAAFCGLLAHVPFNYLFVYLFGWGYLGCAAATVAFQVLQPIGMIMYLQTVRGQARLWHQMGADGMRHARRNRPSIFATLKLAVSQGIGQYLGLALPGVIIISEWWASEIAIFLSGRFENAAVTLGAMTLYQSINSTCFMFPVAFSIAGSTRVSTWLGAGHSSAAARASNISVVNAGGVSSMLGLILFMTPHSFFPSLFAPSEVELYKQAGQLMPLLALYVFADGIQTALNGTIKGCGRQALVMPVVVIAYWFVGLPLAYYWAFDQECSSLCGDVGLVSGMTAGTWTHMVLLAVLVLCWTDWPAEARKAHARLTAST